MFYIVSSGTFGQLTSRSRLTILASLVGAISLAATIILGAQGGLFVKLIGLLMVVIFFLSAVTDEVRGEVLPFFFTSLVFLGLLTRIIPLFTVIPTPYYLFEIEISSRPLIVFFTILPPLILAALAVFFMAGIFLLEELSDRSLMGSGDIKCLFGFFLLPLPLDIVCPSLLSGLFFTVAVTLSIHRYKLSDSIRAVPLFLTGFGLSSPILLALV